MESAFSDLYPVNLPFVPVSLHGFHFSFSLFKAAVTNYHLILILLGSTSAQVFFMLALC